ncbi:MAG: glycosyltransferase [Gammaproteobacteria bacterium]|nr:glycosyltransferase [Gammaproteobacteria bacterium]
MQQSIERYYPKVSIVMPVFNGERYVVAAIESALAQTYTNFEVVIVDDGSQDDSHDKVAPYLSLPNIRYIRKENRGVAAARNTAINSAAGELISFLDQDDVWMPHKLERQVRYLAEHPEVALVHSYQGYIDQTGKEITNPKDWIAPLSGDCFAELFRRNRIAVLTVLVRKCSLEQVGALNENLSGADDYELWLRLARRFQFGFIPETLASYRIHASNVSHDLFKMTVRELQSLESVLAIDPAARLAIGPRIVNRRLAALNYAAGTWYTWQEQDFDKARAFFCTALSQRPLDWLNWKGFVWCSLSSSQRKTLAWYGHRLKNLVASKQIH